MTLADVLELAREHPVAAALELGSVLTCALLLLALVVAFLAGPPTGTGGPWLAIVFVGAGFVLFWTLCWPVYERLRYGS